jgi:hypothetical protein
VKKTGSIGDLKPARRLGSYLSWLFLLSATFAICIQYRPRSTVEIRDLGVWTLAGELIISKADPYTATDGLFKSGVFSALLIKSVAAIFGEYGYLLLLTVFLANILGVVLLIRALGVNNLQDNLLFTSFFILCSPFREIFVNGQLTGIIYGGIAFVYLWLKRNAKSNAMNLFLLSTFIVFLVDLKPNLTVFPLILVLLFTRKYIVGAVTVLLFIFYHILISLYVGLFLDKSWLETLLNLNSTQSNPNLFGSISIWQILNLTITGSAVKTILDLVPTVAFLLLNLLAFVLIKKDQFQNSIALSFLSSFFLSYSHFYSYLPILAICILLCLNRDWWIWLGFFGSLFFVSFEPANNLVLAVLGIIPFIFAFSNYYLSTKFLVYLSFGWFSSLFLRFLVIGVVEEELLARSIVASFPVVWLLFVFTIGRQTSSEGRL